MIDYDELEYPQLSYSTIQYIKVVYELLFSQGIKWLKILISSFDERWKKVNIYRYAYIHIYIYTKKSVQYRWYIYIKVKIKTHMQRWSVKKIYLLPYWYNKYMHKYWNSNL